MGLDSGRGGRMGLEREGGGKMELKSGIDNYMGL